MSLENIENFKKGKPKKKKIPYSKQPIGRQSQYQLLLGGQKLESSLKIPVSNSSKNPVKTMALATNISPLKKL